MTLKDLLETLVEYEILSLHLDPEHAELSTNFTVGEIVEEYYNKHVLKIRRNIDCLDVWFA